MQNKSALCCTGAAINGICGEARRGEGLKGNKRWDLNVGSRKSDTFHLVNSGHRDGVHTSTWACIDTYTHWQNHEIVLGSSRKRTVFLCLFVCLYFSLWRGYFVYVDVIFHIVQICPSRISVTFTGDKTHRFFQQSFLKKSDACCIKIGNSQNSIIFVEPKLTATLWVFLSWKSIWSVQLCNWNQTEGKCEHLSTSVGRTT